MRRVRLLVMAGILTAAVAPQAHAAAPGPRLAEAAGTRFPDRAFALTLPEARSLDPSQVEVREDGRPVAGVTVSSTSGAAARAFSVVLAIDTSTSMSGAPLRGAVAAARVFVSHRRPGQPVALVTFGGDVRVALPFTTNARAIDRALSKVSISGGGSRILDAASRSIEILHAAHAGSGSVVLLSDGADRGSVIAMDGVAASAKASEARVFSIGLDSASNDFGTLNLLAAETRGEFSSARSSQDLIRVFDRLGATLANQYLVQYRSPAGPDRRVQVDVRVAGVAGSARAAYETPATDPRHRTPFHRSAGQAFWLSPGAAVLISLVAALLLAVAISSLLRPRGRPLRDRMASYVRAVQAPPAEQRETVRVDPARAHRRSLLENLQWWGGFQESVDVGRITVAPRVLLVWIALGTAMLLVLPILAGSPLFALLALGVPIGVHQYVAHRALKEREAFTEQLPDNLQMIASAMRAGHSFAGALTVVVEDAPEPSRRELRHVIADERLGMPLDAALSLVAERMRSKELQQVAFVAAIQRETGGNAAEVLERVTDTVRDLMALRRSVQALTAQGRMSRWVLTVIPIALLGFMTLINPTYVRPLYGTPLGQVLLGCSAVMVVAGSLVIKKIVNIKV